MVFLLKLKGRKIAIVGQNGSGKSTLLKLLADLFVPTKGKILINNVDLREIKQELYWEKLRLFFRIFLNLSFQLEILFLLERWEKLKST